MREVNANWVGYHIPMKFSVGNFVNYKQFMEWHSKHKTLDEVHPPLEKREYELLSFDIGTHILHNILRSNYEMTQFSEDVIKHFANGSWLHKDTINQQVWPEVIALEEKLKDFPEFNKLYLKYKS